MDNFDDGEVPAIPRENLDALLAELIAEHPAHDVANTVEARRALLDCARRDLAQTPFANMAMWASSDDPDVREKAWRDWSGRLVTDLRNSATNPKWQGDGRRFAPKLSKWLRGRMAMQELPEHERAEPASSGKQAVEAHAVACGLGTFEQWQVSEYGRTGCVQSWASFRKAVDAKRGVQA